VMSDSSFLCEIVSNTEVSSLRTLTTHRANIRPLDTWLRVVAILTFGEFRRRRSNGESSDGTCDLHVDDVGSCDFGV
jgi:hypothetical protein